MKTTKIATALAGLAWVFAVHAETGTKDQEFLVKAAGGGLYEVQAGQLAQEKGQSASVKAFGAALAKDHGAANDELKALAARKGVTLPAAIAADKKVRLAHLAQSKNFDREFVEEVGLDDHKSDIWLFEMAANESEDADIKLFAVKTFPTLRAHRAHAEGLRKGGVQ